MSSALVVFPQELHLRVLFLFGIGLHIDYAVVDEFLHNLIEYKSRDTLALPLGQHTYKQQFHTVGVFVSL